MMQSIRKIYDAIGFLPKAEQNKLRQQQSKIVIPFHTGLRNLIVSLAYLQDITKKRGEYLHTATAGAEGTVYHISLDGFAEVVKGLETHVQVFEMVGLADTIKILIYMLYLMNQQKNTGLPSRSSLVSTDIQPRNSTSKAKDNMKLKLLKKLANAHILIILTHLVLINHHMPPTWLHYKSLINTKYGTSSSTRKTPLPQLK